MGNRDKHRLRVFRPEVNPDETVVISGIGLIASTGRNREAVWRAVRQGRSGMRFLTGLEGIPDGTVIGAPVVGFDPQPPGRLKAVALAEIAADEAVADAGLDFGPRSRHAIDRDRFGCAQSSHMGDTRWISEQCGRPRDASAVSWWEQMFPCSAGTAIANRYGLGGPCVSHSAACASGLVDFLSAVRTIADGQADLMLAGAAEVIHPLLVAGFEQMRVLAHHADPSQACRPFDSARTGFVMGEGAAVLIVERLSHALARDARIYATVAGGKSLSDAWHLTSVDPDQSALAQTISATLRQARVSPAEIGYVNAHGTGTEQNDVMESRAIHSALGAAAERTCVSSTKSMLGHLLNAAGIMELAVTALALRDGFIPPTVNLTHPDPRCNLDCVPHRGRASQFDTALKLSVAFGGHVVAVALRRWNDVQSGFGYPQRKAA